MNRILIAVLFIQNILCVNPNDVLTKAKWLGKQLKNPNASPLMFEAKIEEIHNMIAEYGQEMKYQDLKKRSGGKLEQKEKGEKIIIRVGHMLSHFEKSKRLLR